MDPAAGRPAPDRRGWLEAAQRRLSHPARRPDARAGDPRRAARHELAHARVLRRQSSRPPAGGAALRPAQSRRDTVDASEPRNLVPDVPPKLKRTLRWRLNRLRCMTPVEVAHRVLRAVLARAERSGIVRAPVVPALEATEPAKHWVHGDVGIAPGPYLAPPQ